MKRKVKRKDSKTLIMLIGLIVVSTLKPKAAGSAKAAPVKGGGGKFGGGGASGSW